MKLEVRSDGVRSPSRASIVIIQNLEQQSFAIHFCAKDADWMAVWSG